MHTPAAAHGPSLLVFSVLLCGALPGCVVGVQPPPTQAEASKGPPPRVPEAQPASAARAARVWIDGYWHYDGVRHVWISGRWQDAAPAYRWSAR
jgi:hypothetical protein